MSQSLQKAVEFPHIYESLNNVGRLAKNIHYGVNFAHGAKSAKVFKVFWFPFNLSRRSHIKNTNQRSESLYAIVRLFKLPLKLNRLPSFSHPNADKRRFNINYPS